MTEDKHPAERSGFALLIVGPAMVLAAFFLPWSVGAGALSGRQFSGNDLALLLRRVDLAGESAVALPGALALSLLPAVSAAGLSLNLAMKVMRATGQGLNRCLLLLGLYPLAVAAGALVLLRLRLTDALGREPQNGLLLVFVGAALWLVGAWLQRAACRADPKPTQRRLEADQRR